MSIIEIDVSERPICPQCNQRDRVEPIGCPSEWSKALDCWWCSRCTGRLSALPVPVTPPTRPRGRKRKGEGRS